MNVLSLFDGMSCGQIALNKVNIPYDKYFASEIDSDAIKVTQHNYPNTIQLGDVTKISGKDLPKIDLLIGGSPCQGFSFAGKQLNFDDPRSRLFFEFVRLKNELNPKYFLLENVKMKKIHEDIISENLGVKPIFINSSLVSAQDRKRLYWTNIPNIDQPEDKGIYFKDILSAQDIDEKLYLTSHVQSRYARTVGYTKNKNKSCVIGRLSPYQGDRVFDIECKGSSLSAFGGNNGGGGCNIIEDPSNKRLRRLSIRECARLQTIPDDYKLPNTTSSYRQLGNGWTVDVIVHIFGNADFK